MKTNLNSKAGNNVQEAISKSMAVVISIALLSISLNAQDFNYSIFEKSSFNETTLAMADNSTETSISSASSDALVAFTETESEEALQLEDWMMNESNFSALYLVAEENESPMELESWMSNEAIFNSTSAYLEVENEETLALESWMTDESTFSKSSFQLIEETENDLELENWMLNEDLFSTLTNVDQPLALENWMVSENIWK